MKRNEDVEIERKKTRKSNENTRTSVKKDIPTSVKGSKRTPPLKVENYV